MAATPTSNKDNKMAKISKNNTNLSKLETYILDRIPIRYYEKLSKFLLNLEAKYSTHLHNRRIDEFVKIVLEDIHNPIVSTIIKNQGEYLKSQYRVIPNGVDEFRQLTIAVRIAKELVKSLSPFVGIQPMNGPVGLAYRLAYREDTEGEDSGKVCIDITANPVEARTRKLDAVVPLESAFDAQKMYGIDVEAEINRALANEIVHSYFSEVINDLVSGATNDGALSIVAEDFSINAKEIITKILYASTRIADRTRRAMGNYVIVPPLAVSILQSDTSGTFVPISTQIKQSEHGTLVGTIDNRINVYCSTLPIFDNKILVGYKGGETTKQTDTGYILCPYIILITNLPMVNAESFLLSQGLLTRYGKVAFNDETVPKYSRSSNYYSVIDLDIQ